MNSFHMILLILILGWILYRLESKEAMENWHVKKLLKEARRSKPLHARNPARYGTIGYRRVP